MHNASLRHACAPAFVHAATSAAARPGHICRSKARPHLPQQGQATSAAAWLRAHMQSGSLPVQTVVLSNGRVAVGQRPHRCFEQAQDGGRGGPIAMWASFAHGRPGLAGNGARLIWGEQGEPAAKARTEMAVVGLRGP